MYLPCLGDTKPETRPCSDEEHQDAMEALVSEAGRGSFSAEANRRAKSFQIFMVSIWLYDMKYHIYVYIMI